MDNSVEVESITLKELLNKNGLTIPAYQRHYVWESEQINQLFNDLAEYHQTPNPKPLYYLGNIILHNENGKNYIVDGQQRITTACIIQAVQNNHTEITTEDLSIHYEIARENIPKTCINAITSNSQYKTFDPTIINGTGKTVNNIDLSHNFFEHRNATGKPLSAKDIIKAHHLRAINKENRQQYARAWEALDDNALNDTISYLTVIRSCNSIKNRQFDEYESNNKEDYIKQCFIDNISSNKANNDYLLKCQSKLPELRQPLSAGKNTLDYIIHYTQIYNILFRPEDSPTFTKIIQQLQLTYNDKKALELFHQNFIDKNLGYLQSEYYLYELFKISLICYISRFGFKHLLEVSLYLFIGIYSLRIHYDTLMKSSIKDKLFHQKPILDNILYAYTTDEIINYLKEIVSNVSTGQYKDYFSSLYDQESKVRGKRKVKNLLNFLLKYFENHLPEHLQKERKESFDYYEDNPEHFKRDIIQLVEHKINYIKGYKNDE